jgi:hypothetical protein
MALNLNFSADVGVAVADLPATMTWAGTAYSCVCDAMGRGVELSEAMPFENISFLIVVQTSLFTGNRPVAGDVVTVGGKQYRIINVAADEADAALNIMCSEYTG